MANKRIVWTVPSSGAFTEVDKMLIEEGWTVENFENFLEQMEVEFPVRIGIFDYLEKSFIGVSGCQIWKFQLAKKDGISVIYVTHNGETKRYRINKKEQHNQPTVTVLT